MSRTKLKTDEDNTKEGFTGNMQDSPMDESDDERTNIKSELSNMSFEDLMKLKEKLGARIYNETIFGKKTTTITHRSTKKSFKRENKNRPREMSSKHPVPLITKRKSKKELETDTGPRDPRFDPNCGEFNAKRFQENFEFVNEIKDKELSELKVKLRETDDEEERKKIRFLIQRMENQRLEKKKLAIKDEAEKEQADKIKIAKQDSKNPFYFTKRERKAHELVKQYSDLKATGKLDKHLEKRRKKNASRDRKKFD